MSSLEKRQLSSSPEPAVGGGNDISNGIMEIVRPSIVKLDEQVKKTRISQISLSNDIGKLSEYLKDIVDNQKMTYDLDRYVRKLDDSQKRISSVDTRLQLLHERMNHLQRIVAKERHVTLSKLQQAETEENT